MGNQVPLGSPFSLFEKVTDCKWFQELALDGVAEWIRTPNLAIKVLQPQLHLSEADQFASMSSSFWGA
jgi:hypothetical protein